MEQRHTRSANHPPGPERSMMDNYDGSLTKSEFASTAVNRVINTLIQRNFDGEGPQSRAGKQSAARLDKYR